MEVIPYLFDIHWNRLHILKNPKMASVCHLLKKIEDGDGACQWWPSWILKMLNILQLATKLILSLHAWINNNIL